MSTTPTSFLPPSYHSPSTSFHGGHQSINGETTPVDANSFVTVPINGTSTRKVQKLTLANGYYCGDTLSGLKDGKGAQFNQNKDIIYDGDWVKNKRHGHGVSFDPQAGLTYTGKWEENVKQGAGTITFSNGSVYFDGTFSDDQPSSGTMNVQDEGTYRGEWQDGQFHSGTFIDLNGKVLNYTNGQIVETTKCCIIL